MLYTKPSNKSYVDMCKEFDNEFYSGNRDDSKLYKYMYLIYYMLACKKNYFHKFEDYDEYAQFSATTIYMRYLKKEKNGEQIKSILNYAKSSMYPLKVMYQNENFLKISNPNAKNSIDAIEMSQKLKNSIQSDYSIGLHEAIIEILKTLPSVIKQTVYNTPYSSDKLMTKKLYLSCLLTLLNSITLSNANKHRCEKKAKSKTLTDEFVLNLLAKEREEDPLLWKLDDSMKDYVRVLTNKVRAVLNDKIIEEKSLYELSDDVLDAIISSSTFDELGIKGDWDSEE